MSEFVKPTIEYFELSPLLVVFAVACLGVLIEAFAPRGIRFRVQTVVAFVGLAAALALTVAVALRLDTHAVEGTTIARGLIGAMGTITVDGPTVFIWGLVLILAILGVALFAERQLEGGLSAFSGQAAALPGSDSEREASARGWEHTEVYPLLVFAVGGMLLFPAANDLLTLFVGLEVLSLPLYLLCGLARRRRLLSQEAALKYFLLGAFSSAFFLYGVAMVYGFAGAMDFASISNAVNNGTQNQALLMIGIGMLAVGLLFKVGAAPFQAWTPDVYQGAPTPVTAFMSAATKVAAFGAILRLFYVAFGTERWTWLPVFWIIAVLSMLVGAVLALSQTDVKRLLAYSSVAHTGFLLTGVLGLQARSDLSPGEISSLESVLFYLVTYAFASLGAFALVSLVRDANGEVTALDRWAGLGKESPVIAAVFALFLLAMAGIPLTSGFIGKWAVFASALAAGAWPVVVIAVLVSVVTAVFYVRVIKAMYFDERPEGSESLAVTYPSVLTAGTVAVCAVLTVVLGIIPGPVLDLAARAGEFIR